MGRWTWDDEKGDWGIVGHEWKDIPNELYGLLCKFHAYEKTGLEPEQITELIEVKKATEVRTCGTCASDGMDYELDEMVCTDPESEFTGSSAMYHRNCSCWKPKEVDVDA